jgi:hypothetical protein
MLRKPSRRIIVPLIFRTPVVRILAGILRCFENGCAEGALECGSLLPLLLRELARVLTAATSAARGQQAGLEKSGSKLPHSKALRAISGFLGSAGGMSALRSR